MPATNNDFDEWDIDSNDDDNDGNRDENGDVTPPAPIMFSDIDELDFSESKALASKPIISSNAVVMSSRLFSSLTGDEEPLYPLPPDTMMDVYYQRHIERRCVLCTAPEHLRLRAEHVYLEDQTRKPTSVINFFQYYYNARLTHQCVAEHMKRHVYLEHLHRDGLRDLADNETSAMIWKYRELDLVLTALVTQLGEMRGLDLKTKEEKFKQTAQVQSLCGNIMKLQKQRDDAAAYGINPFEVLQRLMEKMPTRDAKRIIAEEARSLREKLSREEGND